jgi:hypothetical protein
MACSRAAPEVARLSLTLRRLSITVKVTRRAPGGRSGRGDGLGPEVVSRMGRCSLGQMNGSLFARFVTRAGLPGDASLCQVVNAVQAVPYGRPGARTAEGVIGEWKGTCSTKHALLAQLLGERWPELQPRLVHRVYRVSRSSVLQRYGAGASGEVPEGGLTDVHRYLMMILAGQELTIDITFPGDQAWDGHRSMRLACGEGHDFPAGNDPDAEKAALEASYCDPQVREPFIASLALASSRAGCI